MPTLDPLGRVLNSAFRSGARLSFLEWSWSIRTRTIGRLCVPSGRLVAGDPYLLQFPNAAAFSRTVKPGAYPVQLSIAALQAAPKSLRKKLPYKNDRGRIASARVLFGNEPIAKWELAVCPGQTVESLKPGEVHAYGVDSGSGAFIDQLVLTKAGTSLSDPSLQKRMYKSMGPVQGLGNAALFEFSPNQNIAIFDTFDGDGAYATYWGLNKRGRAVCLATNFFGVPEEDA